MNKKMKVKTIIAQHPKGGYYSVDEDVVLRSDDVTALLQWAIDRPLDGMT